MFVKKLVDAGEPAESIAGVGDEALIVEGTHVLETPHRRLAADTVLLWVDGDKEYRLESDLDRDDDGRDRAVGRARRMGRDR